MNKVISTTEARANFNFLRETFAGNDRAVITPGYLRFDQLATDQSTVRFNTKINQGAERAPEQRLQQSDAFFITHLGVFASAQADGEPEGSAALQTFATAAPFGVSAPGINTLLMSGRVNLTQDSVTLLNALPAMGGREIGQAQTGVAGAEASQFTRDNSLQPLVPGIRLNGGSSISLTLSVDEAVVTVAPVGFTNVLTVLVMGFLAQNCAEYNTGVRHLNL